MKPPYVLSINFDLCTDNCHICERILPKFKTVYKGVINVSEAAYVREDVKQGIYKVIQSCPTQAIVFDTK